MIKRYSKVLAISLLYYLIACVKESHTITFTPGRDISIHFPSKDTRAFNISYLALDGHEYIQYEDVDSARIELHDLYSSKIMHIIPLDAMFKTSQSNYSSFIIHSLDSIFAFIVETKDIYLLDSKGNIKNKYTLRSKLNGTTDYVIQTMQQMPMLYDHNRLLVMNTRTDISLNTASERVIYFSSTPETIMKINDTITLDSSDFVSWPNLYRLRGYHDYWPSRCVDQDGNRIYSFSVSDSIYKYNLDGHRTVHLATSKYFKLPLPYPDNKLGDHLYLKKYWITQSVFDKIIFDPYRLLYYRIIKHAINYTKNDEELNTLADKPWSVIVLNQNFEKLDEVLFDPALHSADFFIPAKDGILISKKKKSGIDIDLTLFDLNIKKT